MIQKEQEERKKVEKTMKGEREREQIEKEMQELERLNFVNNRKHERTFCQSYSSLQIVCCRPYQPWKPNK